MEKMEFLARRPRNLFPLVEKARIKLDVVDGPIGTEVNINGWGFYTGSSFTMPGWATYTLIGIGVIAVGFFAFRAGRRTTFHTPQ